MATVPLSRVQSIYTSKEFGPSHRRNPGLLFDSLSFCPIEPQDCVSIERRTKGAFPLTLFCKNSGYRESQTFHRNTPILIEPSLETVSQQAQTIKFSPSKICTLPQQIVEFKPQWAPGMWKNGEARNPNSSSCSACGTFTTKEASW